jgi:hydrophobic/amphiphilic exporter-1 (mainly G- bacteria), HAE1 family
MLIRKSAFAMILLALFAAAGLFLGSKLPSSFVPDEDQGYIFLQVQLPNAASLQRTDALVHKAEADPRKRRVWNTPPA